MYLQVGLNARRQLLQSGPLSGPCVEALYKAHFVGFCRVRPRQQGLCHVRDHRESKMISSGTNGDLYDGKGPPVKAFPDPKTHHLVILYRASPPPKVLW